jgi:hypothetical protein
MTIDTFGKSLGDSFGTAIRKFEVNEGREITAAEFRIAMVFYGAGAAASRSAAPAVDVPAPPRPAVADMGWKARLDRDLA